MGFMKKQILMFEHFARGKSKIFGLTLLFGGVAFLLTNELVNLAAGFCIFFLARLRQVLHVESNYGFRVVNYKFGRFTFSKSWSSFLICLIRLSSVLVVSSPFFGRRERATEVAPHGIERDGPTWLSMSSFGQNTTAHQVCTSWEVDCCCLLL